MDRTYFIEVFDYFFSNITDDMYMEMTPYDTEKMVEPLLLSAIHDFQFPKVNLNDYVEYYVADLIKYQGKESDGVIVDALVYDGGYFNVVLTEEEKNILAHYMIVHWLSQQVASVENIRMKYSGIDFKMSSQANHLAKLLALQKQYQDIAFTLQRRYDYRRKNKNGIYETNLSDLASYNNNKRWGDFYAR